MSWVALLAVLKLLGVACASLGIVLAVSVAALAPDTLPRRLCFRYIASLERRMRLMFIDTRGLHVLVAQGVSMLLVIGASVAFGSPAALLLVLVIAIAPVAFLERMRKKRVQQIEQKLDGFVVALANALRATSSPGKALASIQAVTPAPLDREIELVLREMRVGSTLEQAIGNLSARVRSFQLDAAMSGLLIGRQTGGNVPEILDGAATTLREMARLQGVLRAKTAEGRAQANVLAVFPLVIVFAFDAASPGYFRPLTESPTGVMVMLVAVGLWLGSVLMMRRIMEVEL